MKEKKLTCRWQSIVPFEKKYQIMPLIEISKCRDLMIIHKQFLANLYGSNPFTARKLLLSASDSQLKLLLYLLHFIAIGEIPIDQEGFDSISKARKSRIIFKHFADKTNTKRLIKAERQSQLEHLLKLSSVYKYLLTRLFHLKESKNE